MLKRIFGLLLFLGVTAVIFMASLEHVLKTDHDGPMPVITPQVQPHVPVTVPADSTASIDTAQ